MPYLLNLLIFNKLVYFNKLFLKKHTFLVGLKENSSIFALQTNKRTMKPYKLLLALLAIAYLVGLLQDQFCK